MYKDYITLLIVVRIIVMRVIRNAAKITMLELSTMYIELAPTLMICKYLKSLYSMTQFNRHCSGLGEKCRLLCFGLLETSFYHLNDRLAVKPATTRVF